VIFLLTIKIKDGFGPFSDKGPEEGSRCGEERKDLRIEQSRIRIVGGGASKYASTLLVAGLTKTAL
jgi:hypothetical protein